MGNTKDRVTYNQLNITQFTAGFGWIMKGEPCQNTYMLDHLISLLDDSNDFSWRAAEASHAVLLRQMEQDKVTSWPQTDQGANAQKHLPPSEAGNDNHKKKKKKKNRKTAHIRKIPSPFRVCTSMILQIFLNAK